MMDMINEKDEIIAKMDKEIHKLIRETKKINKSLSKEKDYSHENHNKRIDLNIRLNPSSHMFNKKEAY